MLSFRWILAIGGCLAVAGILAPALPAAHAREARDGHDAQNRGDVVASVWAVPREGVNVTLAEFSRESAISTALEDDSQLEGICVHCKIEVRCRSGELASTCATCPCGLSNATCLAGKAPAEKGWKALLEELPPCTMLRVEYADRDKPENGIRNMTIDRHGALIPVEGLSGRDEKQLQDLRKSVGASRLEVNPRGDRIQFSLKELWTDEKLRRVESALARLGARRSASPPDSATR